MKARDAALGAIHGWPIAWKTSAVDGRFRADGRRELQLLPQDTSSCSRWTPAGGDAGRGRNWRVIGRLNRCCPIRRWPIRTQPGARTFPPDQASFLVAYESRQQEMIAFIKERQLVTIPDYLGRFEIRQLPEAFKPTSPGGFMNPPGVYDKDPSGFYLHPDLQSAVEELLHSRGDRRSAADSWARRHSRPFHSALDREPFEQRDPPPAWRRRLRGRLGALWRRDAPARRTLPGKLRCPGAGPAAFPLSVGAHRRGCESAHRQVDASSRQ